jgi:hypothetical protein
MMCVRPLQILLGSHYLSVSSSNESSESSSETTDAVLLLLLPLLLLQLFRSVLVSNFDFRIDSLVPPLSSSDAVELSTPSHVPTMTNDALIDMPEVTADATAMTRISAMIVKI